MVHLRLNIKTIFGFSVLLFTDKFFRIQTVARTQLVVVVDGEGKKWFQVCFTFQVGE